MLSSQSVEKCRYTLRLIDFCRFGALSLGLASLSFERRKRDRIFVPHVRRFDRHRREVMTPVVKQTPVKTRDEVIAAQPRVSSPVFRGVTAGSGPCLSYQLGDGDSNFH